MSKQITASFKKEFILFSRTYRLLGVCLVFIAFAILDPVMIKGMKMISGWYDDMLNTITEQSEMDIDFSMESVMDAAYGEEPTAAVGVVQSTGDMSSISIIVMLIILNLVAGGEQKKRSTIIPSRAGLRPLSYSLPKFIIYPVTAFITTVIAMCFSYLTSIILFSVNDLSFASVLISGIFMGLFSAFFAAMHLFIGISTGKPAVSAVICIILNMFLPTILSVMGISDKYNPFALVNFSQYTIQASSIGTKLTDYYSPQNILITVLATLILMAIMFFLTLFIQTARKIDNKGGNVLI